MRRFDDAFTFAGWLDRSGFRLFGVRSGSADRYELGVIRQCCM